MHAWIFGKCAKERSEEAVQKQVRPPCSGATLFVQFSMRHSKVYDLHIVQTHLGLGIDDAAQSSRRSASRAFDDKVGT